MMYSGGVHVVSMKLLTRFISTTLTQDVAVMFRFILVLIHRRILTGPYWQQVYRVILNLLSTIVEL